MPKLKVSYITKNRKIFITILSLIIAAVVVFMGVFVALLSTKISQDMQEQYHQKYELYDFSNEDILIKYLDNAYNYSSSYSYDEDEHLNTEEYHKSYDSDNETSYVITVTSDGTFTKELVVFSDDIERFGDTPVFTKNLTDEQIENLKEEIIKSDIKVILHENENSRYSYENSSETYLNKTLEIYCDGEVYRADYKKTESYTSLSTLRDYLISLLSDEDNEEFEEMVNSYYDLNNFTYDFSSEDSSYLMMYSEEIYNTGGIEYKTFTVSIRLNLQGQICTVGSYNDNEENTLKFENYQNTVKNKISSTEIEQIKQAIIDSKFIEYAVPIDIGYQPSASDVSDKGDDYLCKYITVCFNGKSYYAIDDGTNPKLTELKNKFFDIVMNNTENKEPGESE